MHYSPFVTGTGLVVLGNVLPASSVPAVLSRLLLDAAGLGFLLVGLVFLTLNLYGAASRAARRGR